MDPQNWNAFISLLPWILLIGLVFIVMYELYIFDTKSNWDIIRSIVIASTLMLFFTMAASFLFREFALPRSVILIAYILMNILLISWKILYNIIFSKSIGTILFIGSEEEEDKITNQILNQYGKKVHVKFICSSEPINQILKHLQFVDSIMIGSGIENEKKLKVIYHSVEKGKPVYVIPNLYDLLLAHSVNTTIDDTMVMAMKPLGLSMGQQAVKRLYDIVASFIALVLLSPLFIIFALLIKLEDPKGSIFYKQERLGKDNKEFIIYKFRSMVEGAEKMTGPVLAGKNDPRITKVGRFMRKTRVDELPQLLNVLKGDMSIVGPRPEREYFAKQFEKELNHYFYRNIVKPGITGYAQIMGKYTTSVDDKLRFDLFYIRNYSFILDIIIQFKTIIVLFDKTKAEGKKERKERIETKNLTLKS
ncbi:sugar transferase [Ureibacillus thermosphaericus]|uniref:sugar transferase n=1 Tax=Ureibacillus thermosphaericus TaxID=51173 RepID=UPI002ADDE05B|nr:sugar transferase [Ureibacillus thermosphaericus]